MNKLFYTLLMPYNYLMEFRIFRIIKRAKPTSNRLKIMGYLQDTLPTPEEDAIAKLSSRELVAFLETKSNTQPLI